jgi:hypothetical protein
MILRFFGGRGYDVNLCASADLPAQGYARGVPMGGLLPAGDGPPRFVVSALRDPMGVGLERLEIIKGTVVAGEARFQVFEVAAGPGGASVDPATCQPVGQGADSLCAVFDDPTFDPAAPAFYYARVVENPTCRWQAWQCLEAGVDCAVPGTIGEGYEGCCTSAPTQRERAWSSPIWYQP